MRTPGGGSEGVSLASIPLDANFTFALPVYFGRPGTITKMAMPMAGVGPPAGKFYTYVLAWYANTSPSRLGPGAPLWAGYKTVTSIDDGIAHALNVDPRAGYRLFPNLAVERDTLLWACMSMNSDAATFGTAYYNNLASFYPILGSIAPSPPGSPQGRHSIGYKKLSSLIIDVPIGGAGPVLNWDASMLGMTLTHSISSQGSGTATGSIPAIYYQFEASA